MAVYWFSFFNKSMVSKENVDIVVNAPNKPVLKNKTVCSEKFELTEIAVNSPNAREPIVLTKKVDQGKSEASNKWFNPNRSIAPTAPPTPTINTCFNTIRPQSW